MSSALSGDRLQRARLPLCWGKQMIKISFQFIPLKPSPLQRKGFFLVVIKPITRNVTILCLLGMYCQYTIELMLSWFSKLEEAMQTVEQKAPSTSPLNKQVQQSESQVNFKDYKRSSKKKQNKKSISVSVDVDPDYLSQWLQIQRPGEALRVFLWQPYLYNSNLTEFFNILIYIQ